MDSPRRRPDALLFQRLARLFPSAGPLCDRGIRASTDQVVERYPPQMRKVLPEDLTTALDAVSLTFTLDGTAQGRSVRDAIVAMPGGRKSSRPKDKFVSELEFSP